MSKKIHSFTFCQLASRFLMIRYQLFRTAQKTGTHIAAQAAPKDSLVPIRKRLVVWQGLMKDLCEICFQKTTKPWIKHTHAVTSNPFNLSEVCDEDFKPVQPGRRCMKETFYPVLSVVLSCIDIKKGL